MPAVRRRSDLALYAALRGALALVRAAPEPVALGAAAALGRIARDVLGLRRAVADQNLALAFPTLPARERRALARRMYAHFGRVAAETLRFSAARARLALPRVRAEAAVQLHRALLARGRGLIVLTGHLGNWELASAWLASLGQPVAAVVKPPSNRWLARYIDQARRRMGIEPIPMPEARAGVLAALRDNKVVALVADQGPIHGSTWAPFFGRPTKTPEGPGLFAARSGAPVLFGAMVAEPDGGYRVEADLIEDAARGETREVIQRIAERFRERLEAAVRRAPDQYLWTHRLWRRRPPPGWGAR